MARKGQSPLDKLRARLRDEGRVNTHHKERRTMTAAEIEQRFTVMIESVPGYNRHVRQYITKDGYSQVIQVSATTKQFRRSPIAKSPDEMVSCLEAEWEPLG